VNTEVIRATKEAGLISIPGAMTSTEILQAHNAGADIVKIFPAGWLGLSYLKDIKGPINHVKFLAAAGVNEENFKEYLNAGYCAAGISGRFIDRKVIAEGNFEELTRRARIFTDIANAC
jgi:2-dehydro-3-deoxyphosphogluconate aldolase/(4S)-4-hydroxy-2-oxoglutarate aldolase